MTLYSELMSIKKPSDFMKRVEELGYSERKRNGSSHRIFEYDGRPPLSIPSDGLSPGVRRNLVKLILGAKYYQQKGKRT